MKNVPFFRPDALTQYKAVEKQLLRAGVNTSKWRQADQSTLRKIEETLIQVIVRLENKIPLTERHSNADFKKVFLKKEAVRLLREFKQDRDDQIIIEPGKVYYRAKISDGRVKGYRCTFINEDRAFWKKIDQDERVLKALEMIYEGTEEDFQKIYIEYADGDNFRAPTKFVVEHLVRSSSAALNKISAYCDSKRKEPWPWTQPAPHKLKEIVKENMMNRLQQIRAQSHKWVEDLFEGEVEQSEIITDLMAASKKLDSQISDLGKFGGETLSGMRDRVRTQYGDASLENLDNALPNAIRDAVDSITDLKKAIDKQIETMVGHEDVPSFDHMDTPDVDDVSSDTEVDFDIAADDDDSFADVDDLDVSLDDEETSERAKK